MESCRAWRPFSPSLAAGDGSREGVDPCGVVDDSWSRPRRAGGPRGRRPPRRRGRRAAPGRAAAVKGIAIGRVELDGRLEVGQGQLR